MCVQTRIHTHIHISAHSHTHASVCVCVCVCVRQTDRQTDGRTDDRTDRQTDRQICVCCQAPTVTPIVTIHTHTHTHTHTQHTHTHTHTHTHKPTAEMTNRFLTNMTSHLFACSYSRYKQTTCCSEKGFGLLLLQLSLCAVCRLRNCGSDQCHNVTVKCVSLLLVATQVSAAQKRHCWEADTFACAENPCHCMVHLLRVTVGCSL